MYLPEDETTCLKQTHALETFLLETNFGLPNRASQEKCWLAQVPRQIAFATGRVISPRAVKQMRSVINVRYIVVRATKIPANVAF